MSCGTTLGRSTLLTGSEVKLQATTRKLQPWRLSLSQMGARAPAFLCNGVCRSHGFGSLLFVNFRSSGEKEIQKFIYWNKKPISRRKRTNSLSLVRVGITALGSQVG
jgi:hypothetical protein